VLKGALDKVIYKPGDISCWEESIINAIRSWGKPGGSLQLVRETLAESSTPMLDVDEEDLDLSERNLKQCRRKICDSHYTMAVRVLSSFGVAPYNDVTLQELNAKHPFKIKSFPRGTPYGRDGLHGKCPIMLGTVWRHLVSKISVVMIGHSLDGYLDELQFGVGVSGGGEAILYGRLYFMQSIVWLRIVGMMKSVYVVMLSHVGWKSVTLTQPDCTTGNTHYDHDKGCSRAWYLDDGTIVGDTLVIGKVLELIMEDGPHCGLHLNVDKTSELVMKRVSKTIGYMDAVVKINDHQRELLLLRACTGISKLYFAMRTCPPCIFESAQRYFDVALCSALERIITASGPGFGDCLLACRLILFDMLALGPPLMMHYGREDYTSNWLRAVPISGLGQTMNACSRVFAGDIYRDHTVSCVGVIEVDIGLDGGCDRPLRPADMLLYSWDGGLDVCVDLTGSSPLTQTGMANFVPGRVVIDDAQRKRVKYMAKCAAIRYGFLSFSFSSLGELEEDAVNLLKRIRKFSIVLDIEARVVVHIFNMISFAIGKGVGAQIVSRLPSNLL
ncbi:hypothetical protein Tco_1050238, partial [Tanacetum coccineum]